MKIFVADLIDNQTVESIFMVAAKAIRETRNGDPYLAMTLQDRTGTIETRCWDNAIAFSQRFEVDDFVAVRGRVSSFREELQLTLVDLERVDDDLVDLSDFMPHSRWSTHVLFEALTTLIEREIKSSEVRRFLSALFEDEDFKKRYLRAPAAKANHHSFLGGLIEHSLSMARLALSIGRHYEAYYPQMIDTDLLIAGAIIHDMGKIEELSYRRSFDYSTTGRLVGHITLGAQWVADISTSMSPPLDPNLMVQLQHLVLSHHGLLEYGSPVTPRTPEAVLLHQIDMIDSRMNMCWNACQTHLESADGLESWTDYQRLFNGSVYISGEASQGWRTPAPGSLPADGPGVSATTQPGMAGKEQTTRDDREAPRPDVNLSLFDK